MYELELCMAASNRKKKNSNVLKRGVLFSHCKEPKGSSHPDRFSNKTTPRLMSPSEAAQFQGHIYLQRDKTKYLLHQSLHLLWKRTAPLLCPLPNHPLSHMVPLPANFPYFLWAKTGQQPCLDPTPIDHLLSSKEFAMTDLDQS